MGFVVETTAGDVAFSIALGVLLLSVVLEPVVRCCVHRLRAARAWKSIQKREDVDITKYNIFSEALGDRGKWDAARVVTIMLAAFHVSTWGLELSLDLAVRTDGPVDLLNRPPPVVSGGDVDVVGNNTDWIVQKNLNPVDDEGTLGNFKGSLQTGHATSVYRVSDDFVRGSKMVMSWSTVPGNSPSDLFYATGAAAGVGEDASHAAAVQELACSASPTSHNVFLSSSRGEGGQQTLAEWGTVSECEAGPRLFNASNSVDESPPTLILNGSSSSSSNDDDGGASVYVIVEEESSYPSFLYSVWRPVTSPAAASGDSAELVEMQHLFYVSSTTRMAEAIVSGVVNGILTGGGCADLLLQFSITNTTYSLGGGASRVSPFGEIPTFSFVESVDEVEEIIAGIQVSDIGMISGLILLVVTGVSFLGCLGSYFSPRPMDVFDRDAVIRAVALPGGEQELDIASPALKIYVRRSDGRINMVVSDEDTGRRQWSKRCMKLLSLDRDGFSSDGDDNDGGEEEGDAGDNNADANGNAAPTRGISRTWSLPRASMSRLSCDDSSRPNLDVVTGVPDRDRGRQRSAVAVTTPAATSGRPNFVEMVAAPAASDANEGSFVRGVPTSLSSSSVMTGWLSRAKRRSSTAGHHTRRRRNVVDQEQQLPSGDGVLSTIGKNNVVDSDLSTTPNTRGATSSHDFPSPEVARGAAPREGRAVRLPKPSPASGTGRRGEEPIAMDRATPSSEEKDGGSGSHQAGEAVNEEPAANHGAQHFRRMRPSSAPRVNGRVTTTAALRPKPSSAEPSRFNRRAPRPLDDGSVDLSQGAGSGTRLRLGANYGSVKRDVGHGASRVKEARKGDHQASARGIATPPADDYAHFHGSTQTHPVGPAAELSLTE